MGGDDRRIPRPRRELADTHASRKTHSGMPGDLHRHYLPSMRRLRLRSGCRDRLPGSWRLASGRKTHRGPRSPRRRPGRFPNIARWLRSSPMKRRLQPTKQPKPLTLVSSSWRGFWLFRAKPLREGNSATGWQTDHRPLIGQCRPFTKADMHKERWPRLSRGSNTLGAAQFSRTVSLGAS
jgi:hypothetical protein